MTPTIRPYRAEDRAALLRAIDALQDHEEAVHPGSRRTGTAIAAVYLDHLLRRTAEAMGAVFVAEAGGSVVGFIACRVKDSRSLVETEAYTRYGYVSDLEVDPAWRGQGVAARLLAAAERHLAATGAVTRMRLTVLAANAPARRAYEKYGFRPYDIELDKPIAPTE
ncbi:MAG TPA: N-acetyltransferase [Stellaceae bacterium]|nr:N-acetyltransferase [Stellaceae bacterium]